LFQIAKTATFASRCVISLPPLQLPHLGKTSEHARNSAKITMKVSIRFSLAQGSAVDRPIRIRVGYAGYRLELRSGYVCPADKWDADSMRMRSGTTNRYHESAATINRELSKQEAAISDILSRFELDGVVPEPSVLKEEFNVRVGRSSRSSGGSCSLVDAFTMYLTSPSVVIETNTIGSYVTVQNRLKDFDFADKALDDLNSDDLMEFVSELWLEGLENQSVSLYLTRIRTILRFAKDRRLYSGSLHLEFKPRLKGLGKKDVHYLEWEEFERILYAPLTNALQIATRDAFCFCCATGLRVGDCASLKWSDVHLSCETPHISLVAKKTTKPTIIELNKYSRAIIDRQLRLGIDLDGPVFPPVSMRTRNYELQQIARTAGIEGKVRELSFSGTRVTEVLVDKADAISTHWGRHTFIVRALSIGISPAVVMQWTGHASFESLKPYVAIADSARRSSMDLFNN